MRLQFDYQHYIATVADQRATGQLQGLPVLLPLLFAFVVAVRQVNSKISIDGLVSDWLRKKLSKITDPDVGQLSNFVKSEVME